MAFQATNPHQLNRFLREEARLAHGYRTLIERLTDVRDAATGAQVIGQISALPGDQIGDVGAQKTVVIAALPALDRVRQALEGLDAADRAAIASLLADYGMRSFLPLTQ